MFGIDDAALGAILGGAGQFAGGVGGLFKSSGGNSRQFYDQQNWQQNIINDQMNFAREQFQFQKDAAQHGIQWKANDARAAGLHPLFAMGSPSFNASPIPVAGPSGSELPNMGGGSDIGSSLANMGQGIGRAISATATKEQRIIDAYTEAKRAQDLEKGSLEIEGLRLRNQLANQQLNPPMPSVMDKFGFMQGQGNAPTSSGAVTAVAQTSAGPAEYKPPEIVTASKDNPTVQSGTASPYTRFFRHGGGLIGEPVKDSKAEDEFAAPIMTDWLIRNKLGPNVGFKDGAPPMSQVRAEFPGATGVYFDHATQKWMPLYKGERSYLDRYVDWRNRLGDKLESWRPDYSGDWSRWAR